MEVSALGRRHVLDVKDYVPDWKITVDAYPTQTNMCDCFSIDIASADELASLSVERVRLAANTQIN